MHIDPAGQHGVAAQIDHRALAFSRRERADLAAGHFDACAFDCTASAIEGVIRQQHHGASRWGGCWHGFHGQCGRTHEQRGKG